jgi:hypothetical protein
MPSREIGTRRNAAGPHLDIALGMFRQMRDMGATDAEIESTLDWLERTNPTKADHAVLIVVLEGTPATAGAELVLRERTGADRSRRPWLATLAEWRRAAPFAMKGEPPTSRQAFEVGLRFRSGPSRWHGDKN